MDETPKAPALSLEQIKSFLDSDPEGQKFLQSHTDAKVTKGIETWRQNNLDRLLTEKVEQEISKRYPAETEEQKRLRALEQELAKEREARVRESLRVRALSEATKKGLPTEIIDNFLGADEEATLAEVGKLESIWKSALQRAVEDRFASGGRQPVRTSPDDRQTTFTEEQIARMSPEERRQKWPEIMKAMADGRVK